MAYIISVLTNALRKAINFLFGKTKIFIIIFGWFLVITGGLFLAQPEKARKKLLAQGFGLFKMQLLLVTIYLALCLLSFSAKTTGALSWIVPLAGIILLITVYRSLTKKVYSKLAEQFAKIPIPALKIFAVIQIIVGALMLILQKRIW